MTAQQAVAVTRPRTARVPFAQRVLRGETGPAILGIGPAVLYILALIGFPLVLALYTSFTNATINTGDVRQADFVGLDNYKALIHDAVYQRSLLNTVTFSLGSELIKILLAIPLALLLMRQFRGRKFIRTLVVLPYAVPAFVGALAWRWVLDSTYGLSDWLLINLHITDTPPVWLGEKDLAMASVITVNIWHTLPLTAIVFIAGLTAVPQDLIDAAMMDGASFIQRLWHVMLPVMAPVVFVGMLFSFVFTFSEMSIVYILTRGGPENATQVLPTMAFQTAIVNGQLGLGTAIGLSMLPILGGVAFLLLRMLGTGDES
jgi:multiple sugar transport system permease protein